MNGLLDECHIRFRNCCDKNKSHSKMFGLLDDKIKTCSQKLSFYLLGLMDYGMTSKLELEPVTKRNYF